MTEAARYARNAQRLLECYVPFAHRVRGLLADLEAAGWRPRIQEGYRTPAKQLEAFQRGTSKLRYGFHNVTAADGTPQALAVDILDDSAPLQPSAAYLLTLAHHARTRGLRTGILWGLPKALATATDEAVRALDVAAPVRIGWDPTHCETTGLTVSDAKAGKRPL